MMCICTVSLSKQKICNAICCMPLEAFSHPTCLCIAGSPIKDIITDFIGLQNIGCDHWSREIHLELSVMPSRNSMLACSCVRNNLVFLV